MTRRATQTSERPKDLIDNTPRTFHKLDIPINKTKTLTMARSKKTKRVTRKGSKQLTDEERASQVASPIRSLSPKIPPGKIDDPIMIDPATLTESGIRSQAFARQIAADEAQEKRANTTKEERSIEIQEKRAQMIANDRKRAERAKQRANTRGSAVLEPLEIIDDTDENDNDSDNDNQEDDLLYNDSNYDPDKGGYRDTNYTHVRNNDPDDNDPGDDSDPDND